MEVETEEESGNLLAGKGMKNRYQPYGTCIWKNFDGLNELPLQFDTVTNWFMHGYNIKRILPYSSGTVYVIKNGNYNRTYSKGEMILQTQIFF